MADIIRDSAFGQIVRYVTRGKYFLYPEEKVDFDVPSYIGSTTSPGSPDHDEKDEETASGTATARRAVTDYAETVTRSSMFDAALPHQHLHGV